ncbi:MAG: glycosyltransferase [Oscillospiraceae bacterium]|nr:glycosyltransferase [Oscillospiraceae bacterium]
MTKLNIALMNDSFPPTIDGVANAVVNYARAIDGNDLGNVVVATPWYPDSEDHKFSFPVIRYPSAYISKKLGYRAGYPFDPRVIHLLKKQKIDLIHSHCPFISTVLARVLRFFTGAPIVFTYHTKFDYDIEKRVVFSPARSVSIKFLMNNINACDEVWVVSEGAGENLRSLGYTGEYIVMENGTDFRRGRASDEEIGALNEKHGLTEDVPVFLFVGRMMWYKGVKISLDGLKYAKDRGVKFKMILVGNGHDREEMMEYTEKIGIADDCIFTGAIRDRELLRAYFSRADLFLFPSTYDTNGIVVREAAACSCPSVLIKGSCAAEGVLDGDTGLLIEENGDSMGRMLLRACGDRAMLRQIGRNAADRLYVSWDDAVKKAYARYEEVVRRGTGKADKPALNQVFFEEVQLLREDYHYRKDELQRQMTEYCEGQMQKFQLDADRFKDEYQQHKAQFQQQMTGYYDRQMQKLRLKGEHLKGKIYHFTGKDR